MHACMYEFVFLSAARRLSKLQNRCMCHTRARRNTRHRMDGLWPGSRGASRHPASRHSWVAMQAARSRCRARARPHKAGGPIPTGFVGALRPAVSSPLGPGQALDRSAARGEVGTNGAPRLRPGLERRTKPGRACGRHRVSHPAGRRRCLGRHAHMRLNSLVIPPVARVPVAGRP